MVSSISEISPHEWDACSLDAAGPNQFNPFLTHGFLSSLEETGCAVKVAKFLLLCYWLAISFITCMRISVYIVLDSITFVWIRKGYKIYAYPLKGENKISLKDDPCILPLDIILFRIWGWVVWMNQKKAR